MRSKEMEPTGTDMPAKCSLLPFSEGMRGCVFYLKCSNAAICFDEDGDLWKWDEKEWIGIGLSGSAFFWGELNQRWWLLAEPGAEPIQHGDSFERWIELLAESASKVWMRELRQPLRLFKEEPFLMDEGLAREAKEMSPGARREWAALLRKWEKELDASAALLEACAHTFQGLTVEMIEQN